MVRGLLERRDAERDEPDMGSRARVNGRAMIVATLPIQPAEMPTQIGRSPCT